METNKALGPDHITTDTVKIITEVTLDILLSVLNQLLDQQIFPAEWKESQVVLIWKGKSTNTPSDYKSTVHAIKSILQVIKISEKKVGGSRRTSSKALGMLSTLPLE